MPDYLKTKGVVLRKYPFQDHHKIVTIFTQKHGKVKALCKGINKIKSKFAPHLELGMISDFMIYNGRSDLMTLTHVKSIKIHKNIRADLKKTSSLYYIMELVDNLTEADYNDPAIFSLLNETLDFLDGTKNKEKEMLAVLSFNIKFLKQMGYLPHFYNCLKCNEEVKEEEYHFSYQGGGLVCKNCPDTDVGIKLSSDHIKTMRHLERSSFDQVKNLNVSNEIVEKSELSLSQYIHYLFSKKLQSSEFLRRV